MNTKNEDKLLSLKRQLSVDKFSVLYLVDNINKTILKKLNRSKYPKDITFKNLLKKNKVEDIPLEKPIFTPFSRRKNDEQSTLYSFTGPLQRLHADIADIRFLKPNASEPKYVLVVVDLFSSFTYIVPMKNRGNLNIAVETFYDTIHKDRTMIVNNNNNNDLSPLYIQTDMEFERNDVKLLNTQRNVFMYSTKMNSGHAFAAEQKIRELKKKLTKQRRAFTDKKRHLSKNLKDAVTQMNSTSNEKYSVKPENVQRLTIEDDSLRKVYNQYRLNKVKKGYDRISRHETEILKKKKKHLRELFIGDLVFVEAGRIKKKDQPSVLTKSTTDLKPHYNTNIIYKIVYKKLHRESGPFVHYFYRVEAVDDKKHKISNRLSRDELFAIVNNSIF